MSAIPVSERPKPKNMITRRFKNRIRKSAIMSASVLAVSALSGSAVAAELLLLSDFETGAIQPEREFHDAWGQQNGGLEGATVVQSEVVRSGKYAMRHYLERADWDGTNPIQGTIRPRAQLIKGPSFLPIKLDTEYWTGVSVFIPEDWQNDENFDNQVVLWQFHGSGVSGGGYSPPLVLQNRGHLLRILNRCGDIDGIESPLDTHIIWEAEIDEHKGKWMDFVIHMNMSRETGYIEIWMNEDKIVDVHDRPTLYYYSTKGDGKDPLYFLLSLYKSRYVKQFTSVPNYTVYYDEVRIAQGPDGKELVSPKD